MVPTLAFIFSPMEMLIVGGIFVLLFGGRIPTVMRSLGQSVTSFKSGLQDDEEEKPDENLGAKRK